MVCCIQAFWHEYFGTSTSLLLLRDIPSSMFAVVAQGVQIADPDSPWAQVQVRRFSIFISKSKFEDLSFIFTVMVIVHAFKGKKCR